MKNRVIIGLGSNINPKENIEKALKALERDYQLISRSAFVETIPVGFEDKRNFLNGAVLIETETSLDELKGQLSALERQLGRKESEKSYTSRTIDLDIVIFNEKIVDQDIYKREFLKNSVLELMPTLKV